MKHKFTPVLLFGLLLVLPPASAEESGTPAGGELTHSYMLTYLLDEGGRRIDGEISTLSEELERAADDSEKAAMLRYALGALHVYRYIRLERRDDVFRAKELLEASAGRYEDSYFHRVHLGMAHAFIARIRKVFGVGNLKRMQELMESIPRDHPDWLLRFLRGTTLVEVGTALPGVFTIREIKAEAVEVGSADLRYVLDVHSRRPLDEFDPRRYDEAALPVPTAVARQSREVLKKAR